MLPMITLQASWVSTCLFLLIQPGLLNALPTTPIGQAKESPSSQVDYLSQVAPILKKNCYPCHGARVQTNGLRLDSRQHALRGGDSGKPLIVPGKSGHSFLFQVLSATESDSFKRMPPSPTLLGAADIDLIRRWIDEGAQWPEEVRSLQHWAFVKPVRPSLPKIEDQAWVRNPIDSFVLARLRSEALGPSPEAPKEVLARRLYLDLIGLPPTLQELEIFLQDRGPEAYGRLVDRLLSSSHYGERWARSWLDAARYADTNGYEKDRVRSIWPYRDWVIDALNRNLPFDQFTVEQLAGDMLPQASRDQMVATGFHRNTMLNEEGGVVVEEFRFASIVDRVNTTATVFLGLTLSCAQCHDHKYDPLSQREYYQFFAFLNNADEPELELPDPDIKAKREIIANEILKLESELASRFPPHGTKTLWSVIKPERVFSAEKASFTQRDDGSIFVSGSNAPSDTYELTFHAEPELFDQLRIELLQDPDLPSQGPGRHQDGDAILSEVQLELWDRRDGARRSLSLLDPRASLSNNDFEIEKALDGDPETGWGVFKTYGNHHAVFDLGESIWNVPERSLVLTLKQHSGLGKNIARFRISTGVEERTHYQPNMPEVLQRQGHLEAKYRSWKEEKRHKARRWIVQQPQRMASENHATLSLLEDGSILASGDRPDRDTYFFELHPNLKRITGLRLEFFEHASLPGNGPGRGTVMEEGNFILSEIVVQSISPPEAGLSAPYSVVGTSADSFHMHLHPGLAADGDRETGWSIQLDKGAPQHAVFEFQEPIRLAEGERLKVTLVQNHIHTHTIGRFRVSLTASGGPLTASGLTAQLEDILLDSKVAPTGEEEGLLKRFFLSQAPDLEEQHLKIADLRASLPEYPKTLVMEERGVPRVTRIHHRGEFLNPTKEVAPAVPQLLHPWTEAHPRNRLSFAEWLVSRENPLIARVTMNRIWSRYFGRGIVSSPSDFGMRSDPPTHPDLLDWLAVEFMDRGWDMKSMHKLIVMSATYLQTSRVTPELLERDPDNSFYARGPRFRVDAETIRDIALTVSGLLNRRIGGPSVFPPQPPEFTKLAFGTVDWQVSEGQDRYRRGLYTFWKRTTPYPSFTTFDAPSGDTTCVRRNRSNTPLQALTLLNDPVFIEAAQAFALSILQKAPFSTLDRIRYAFQRCVSRYPDPAEAEAVELYYHKQMARIRAGEVDLGKVISVTTPLPPGVDSYQLMAWTTVARVLLNLDRTISKD